MKKIFSLFVLACLLLGQGVFAQAKLEDPLPQDPNILVGKLPNGITYYLRHNAEPKERASFYIIRKAGALLEEADENGLAHFLEHMAFQGTQNFPGKGIITTLERHGISFGKDINAYTAHNETVYNISSVPTTDESLLDTCLLILHDWSYYLTLSDEEIDAERGVIAEEWRTRRNSDFRITAQIFPVLLKGSKYAERDVIGSLDVIKNFEYQTIRDFYHKWYRTDLEAIAIVGDFDLKKMEQRVKDILSKIPAVKNPAPRPFYEVPEHDEIYYCLATDKEATGSSVQLINFMRSTPAAEKNTHAYLKDNLLATLYISMINTRLAELMQQANPPYMGGSITFGGFVDGYNAYTLAATAKPNEEAIALETVLTENERVKRYGFTASELERIKTNLLTTLESAYKEKDKTHNDAYINTMQANFLYQEPMVDFSYYYEYMKQLIPTISVAEVNAKAKEWNVAKNQVIIVSGPSENVRHLTKEECLAIMDQVSNAEISAYQDVEVGAELMTEELPGGKIVKTKQLPTFGAVEWTLDNGAKVVFRKADYNKEEVTLASYSKGGTSLYDLDMLPSAQNVSSFIAGFGLGDFNAVTLGKLLTGKMASSSVSITGISESVQGASTPKDVETMMQLVYLRFTKPRFDKEIFESAISRTRAMLPSVMSNPQTIMKDSLTLITSNYHPRALIFNEDYLNQLTLEKMEQIYRDRIKDASDFTFFIVGNVEEETIKPLVEKYLGSLKSEYRKENWKDNKVMGPKGKTVKKIEIELEESKAVVFTRFSKEMKNSLQNDFCNSILKGILDLRYTENIREKEGGTYGVAVQASSSRIPRSIYTMSMQFDCDPEKAEYLKSLIYLEMDKLQKEGPTEEELTKVVSNLLKIREQSKNQNSYWMNVLTTYYVVGTDIHDPKNYEDILNGITVEDIQKFTRLLMKDVDIVDVTFVPKKNS